MTELLPPMLLTGRRVRLRFDVRRPDFTATAGLLGTVVEATRTFAAVRLDSPVPGAETWDNEVWWVDGDRGDLLEDCELLDEVSR